MASREWAAASRPHQIGAASRTGSRGGSDPSRDRGSEGEIDVSRTLLHALVHELLDPIASIKTISSILVREASGVVEVPEDERLDLVQQIDEAAVEMRRTVDEVVYLERLDRGLIEPKRSPTDLAELVEFVVGRMSYVADREIRLRTRSVVIWVDVWEVETIVRNLVRNAAQHSPAGSPIDVAVEPHANGAVLSVIDEGGGVRPDERRSIFEPFHRGNVSHPGIGIGLSLVERFARLHGGYAWVEEAPTGGAAFRVFLRSPRPGGW